MLESYQLAICLFLTAATANLIPPLVAKLLPKLNYPVDGFRTWRGKRLLGDNKTVRGLLFGVTFSGMVFLVLAQTSSILAIFPWYYGFLLGFVALLGDAAKSFIKRQLNIKSGEPWLFFDQTDWIIASVILFLLSGLYDPIMLLIFSLLGIASHIVAKMVGFMLGLTDHWI